MAKAEPSSAREAGSGAAVIEASKLICAVPVVVIVITSVSANGEAATALAISDKAKGVLVALKVLRRVPVPNSVLVASR